MKRWGSLLLVTFLLLQTLCACQDMPSETTPAGLSTDPMDSCAQSSGYRMAETEDRFYICICNRLYYADKADLTNWIPLCNASGCDHAQMECPAHMIFGEFYVKDQRLYSVHQLDLIGLVENSQELAVVSRELDGSDLRIAYELKGSSSEAGTSVGVILTPECTYGQYYEGVYAKLVCTDETGTEILAEQVLGDPNAIFQTAETGPQYLDSANRWYGMRGEFCFLSAVAAEDKSYAYGNEKKLYRLGTSGLEEITGLDLPKRYFSYWDGNTLYYSGKDGYTQLDPATGTTKKYLDKHFASAQGYCLDPDHIIETNINQDVPREDVVMAVYSQGEWWEIDLPREIYMAATGSFAPLALATDSVFFIMTEAVTGIYRLYRIPLDGSADTPILCKAFSVRG